MALTDAKVRSAKPQGKVYELHDGNGLSLVVYPRGNKTWRVRYVAASGRRRRVTLGKYPQVTIVMARAKAANLRSAVKLEGQDPAEEIATERAFQRTKGVELATIVDQYVAENRPTWKDSTARTYLSSINAFKRWAADAKIKHVENLDRSALAKYRAHAVTVTRRVKAKGGSRTDVVSTDHRRSASAINCELRAVKTMLQALRRAGRLPGIASSDDITDNLQLVTADQAKPDPLKPAQLRKLLAACKAHDSETWAMTRAEAKGVVEIGTTPKHEPIAPLVAIMLLTGMRLGEALDLRWDDVDLEDGLILVRARKTHQERKISLSESPAIARLLAAMKERADVEHVFCHTEDTAAAARLRLISDYRAPAFMWSTRHSRPGDRSPPTLRSTCGCYLTCAPNIYGAASLYLASARQGHSAEVAQKHYLGALTKIPKDATTLEAAMGIEAEIDDLISRHAGTSTTR